MFRRHQVRIVEGVEEQVIGAKFDLDTHDGAKEGDRIYHCRKLIEL